MLKEVLESCEEWHLLVIPLTVPLLPPHRNQSTSLLCKSFDWFPYEGNNNDNGLKANVKQNETEELVVRSTYFQNLKCNVKNM